MIDKTYLIILKQKTKMRKILTYAVSALALASCSSDSLVSDSPANTQSPIAFNVGQKNITRDVTTPTEDPLQSKGYYNFGVWAYKYKDGATTGVSVMPHYLVGYSNGTDKGYDYSNVTNQTTWFYEGLGNTQYNASLPYTTSSISVNEKQVLHYWDMSYKTTNFYAYAPYKSSGVSFDEPTKTITVLKAANVAGYDDPQAHDVIYAAKEMTNASHANVPLQFKHLGAQVKLRFCENIPGYTVKLINVNGGTTGIQATPTEDMVNKSEYYTSYDAAIDFSDISNPDVAPKTGGESTKVSTNLIFKVPTDDLPAKVGAGSTQNYVESPTVYYAVAQPEGNKTSFTFHVSYQLTAEDNSEVITVRNARVNVPAAAVTWKPNTRYLYDFTITTNTNGKTSEGTINLDDPSVPDEDGLYPIIFDNVTILDYSEIVNAY